jgi:hypothetical protein
MRFAGLLRHSTGSALLLIGLSAVAFAQSPTDDRGFQPNRDYLALQPFESIDTASGNLILTFTDLEPGAGTQAW